MKTFLLPLFVLGCVVEMKAQNLVPNPSFEEYIHCPIGLNRMDSCMYWRNYGNSPDYYNSCNPLLIPPPFGFQMPHSGNAMAGLGTWRNPGSPDGPNYREYFGVKLNEKLHIGETYFISMFINNSNYHGSLAAVSSDNLGVLFSTVPYDSSHAPPLNNFSIMHADTIVTDTVNWILMFGSFLADSNYHYMAIGNFYDDAHTDTISFALYPDFAYYYIDDVCVTTDSAGCNFTAGVNHLTTETTSISPNPATSLLTITNPSGIKHLTLTNTLGQIVFEQQENFSPQKNITLDVSHFPAGIYFIQLKDETQVQVQQVVIQH